MEFRLLMSVASVEKDYVLVGAVAAAAAVVVVVVVAAAAAAAIVHLLEIFQMVQLWPWIPENQECIVTS
jgi:hypothetical protein